MAFNGTVNLLNNGFNYSPMPYSYTPSPLSYGYRNYTNDFGLSALNEGMARIKNMMNPSYMGYNNQGYFNTPKGFPLGIFDPSSYGNLDKVFAEYLYGNGISFDRWNNLLESNPQLATQIQKNFNENSYLTMLKDNSGFGWNMPTISAGLQALQFAGNFFANQQANRQAKNALAWQKGTWEKQYQQALNDKWIALNDRANNRSAYSGSPKEEVIVPDYDPNKYVG